LGLKIGVAKRIVSQLGVVTLPSTKVVFLKLGLPHFCE
jgi:hypothetical protein